MNEKVSMIVDTVSNPSGTARLVSGARTISRAFGADVTPKQLRAIFTDLKDFSDEEIVGFEAISRGLIDGKISIRKSAFTSSFETDENNSYSCAQTV